MRLYAVRHGQTVENVEGIIMGHHGGQLTRKGIRQAKKIAKILKDYAFSYIYSSDLQRCSDTAKEIIRYHPNTPIEYVKKLRELNLGYLQGKKSADINWDKELGKNRMDGKPKNGESILELRERTRKFIYTLSKKHEQETVLIVTHAGFMRQLISMITNIPNKQIFDTVSILQDKVYEFEINSNGTGEYFPT